MSASFSCNDCKDKICLIKGKNYGKPCKRIEDLLPKVQTGRLKGEFSVDPQMIDETNLSKEYGTRKHPIGIDDSPEDVRQVSKPNTRR